MEMAIRLDEITSHDFAFEGDVIDRPKNADPMGSG